MAKTPSAWETQKLILGKLPATWHNILDVGAFRGDVAIKYRRLFPEARIFCFEPIPEMAKQIAVRFKLDPRVYIITRAVSDRDGEALFYIGGGEGEMSSLNPRPPHGRRYYHHYLRPSGMVPTVTIDKLADEWDLRRINILKLDIHGAEHAALVGASELLFRQGIDLIYVETYFVPLYAGTLLFPDLCKFLEGFGYSLHGLYNWEFAKWNKQLRLADALFVSSKIRDEVLTQFTDEWKEKGANAKG